MKPITLTLQLEQVNQILEALGQQPYVQVYQLIGLIQQQAEAQLRNDEPTTTGSVRPPALDGITAFSKSTSTSA